MIAFQVVNSALKNALVLTAGTWLKTKKRLQMPGVFEKIDYREEKKNVIVKSPIARKNTVNALMQVDPVQLNVIVWDAIIQRMKNMR